MITVKPGAWVAMRRLIVGLLAMLSLTQGIAQAQTCPERDLARVGALMARHDNWGGPQIVSTSWVAESSEEEGIEHRFRPHCERRSGRATPPLA